MRQRLSRKMIADARELYLKYEGRRIERIEREMRARGFLGFYRQVLYSRRVDGKLIKGWPERFGWHKLLTDAQRATLERRRVSSRARFDRWLADTFPEWSWHWKYQRYIYKHLARVTSGHARRLMIFMPPRHGKSEMVTVRYTAWRLLREPGLNVILGSYNQKLADKFSRKIKRIIKNSPPCLGNNILDSVTKLCHNPLTMKETPLPKTLQQAAKAFADEQFCIDLISAMRWSDGQAVCPKCKQTNNHYMASRKVWQCKNKECKKQFSVKVGTIFEDSPISLEKWLLAMWLIVNAKNGISSYELHRAIGLTQKSAWFVLHRIRLAMTVGSIEKLSGEIEIDETYIGGKSKFMHVKKRKELDMQRGYSRKVGVMGMVQRGGKVRAKVIKLADTETCQTAISENIEAGSTVITDDAGGYRKVHEMIEAYRHEVINHAVEYVRDNVHTNNIENFWSLLKRAIKGTYISVSPAHLQKYVEEQMFRYNEREENDQIRFVRLLESISGKRITYSQLIGYETSH